MSLSVIVTSYGAGRLRACLESLVRQPDAEEIVVVDCSAVDPSAALAPLFPDVRFLHFEQKRTVPQLRWAGFRETRGDLVAAVESRCVPAADWCARLVRAHAEHPDAPAVGGTVAVQEPASASDLALYLCEYGAFAPPVETRSAPELSGANLSYKRTALLEVSDLLDAGAWETRLHERWRSQGRTLVLTPATVVFENAMSPATTLRQRLSYGRVYAAARVAGRSPMTRAAYAACCPLLPVLLTARLSSALRAKGLSARLRRSIGWVLLFQIAWAAGETIGYLAGASRRVEIY